MRCCNKLCNCLDRIMARVDEEPSLRYVVWDKLPFIYTWRYHTAFVVTVCSVLFAFFVMLLTTDAELDAQCAKNATNATGSRSVGVNVTDDGCADDGKIQVSFLTMQFIFWLFGYCFYTFLVKRAEMMYARALRKNNTIRRAISAEFMRKVDRKVMHANMRTLRQGALSRPVTPDDAEKLRRIRNKWSTLSHPMLAKIPEVASSLGPLEYTLEDFMLSKLSAPYVFRFIQAANMMFDILTGVEYLHSKNIYHLDLQPRNILVQCDMIHERSKTRNWFRMMAGTDEFDISPCCSTHPIQFSEARTVTVKIGNFDSMKHRENKVVRARCITTEPPYRPPECYVHSTVETDKCDMWGLGIVAHELFTGGNLLMMYSYYAGNPVRFNRFRLLEMSEFCKSMDAAYGIVKNFNLARYYQVRFKTYRLDQTMFMTQCCDFVNKLLKYDRGDRLSLRQAFSHPFMKRCKPLRNVAEIV